MKYYDPKARRRKTTILTSRMDPDDNPMIFFGPNAKTTILTSRMPRDDAVFDFDPNAKSTLTTAGLGPNDNELRAKARAALAAREQLAQNKAPGPATKPDGQKEPRDGRREPWSMVPKETQQTMDDRAKEASKAVTAAENQVKAMKKEIERRDNLKQGDPIPGLTKEQSEFFRSKIRLPSSPTRRSPGGDLKDRMAAAKYGGFLRARYEAVEAAKAELVRLEKAAAEAKFLFGMHRDNAARFREIEAQEQRRKRRGK